MMKGDSQSLASWLHWARAQLPLSATPVLDAELLLTHVLKRPRSHLLSNDGDLLDTASAELFSSLLTRRAAGEPIAYLLGYKDFWTLRLAVTPAVLVPRPETELVVERALCLRNANATTVADLGTGSGAIALACATERPKWRVIGTDVSAAALAIAERNRVALALGNVEFLRGSWCGALPATGFDLILSNPPYIAALDPALDDAALRYEPLSALASGSDGLGDLRAIILGAHERLQPGGWLILEHGATQSAAVAALLVKAGYAHVRCHPDLAGLDRVTEAQKE